MVKDAKEIAEVLAVQLNPASRDRGLVKPQGGLISQNLAGNTKCAGWIDAVQKDHAGVRSKLIGLSHSPCQSLRHSGVAEPREDCEVITKHPLGLPGSNALLIESRPLIAETADGTEAKLRFTSTDRLRFAVHRFKDRKIGIFVCFHGVVGLNARSSIPANDTTQLWITEELA